MKLIKNFYNNFINNLNNKSNMLNEKALIVNLSISQWTGKKNDKKVTQEINDLHATKNDTGHFNKLLVKKESLAPIQKIMTKIRTFHYFNSLPWSNNNERLIPSSIYLEYVKEIGKLQKEYEEECNKFLNSYETLIEEAKDRLKEMFNFSDYPSKLELTDKFGMHTAFFPVPSTDFRVVLDEEEIAKLKSSVEIEIQERLNIAAKDNWKRIKESLNNLKNGLNNKTEGKGSGFRDSLFTNLEEIVNTIPKLNITDDNNITEVIKEISEIAKIDPNDARKNTSVKVDTIQKVDDVMNKFSSFFKN